MRTTFKIMLTALTAAVVLASAVGAASANRLSISNRGIRVVWTPLNFGSGITRIECNVTLEGTFHSNTIVKRERALLGYITRAAIGRPCSGLGEAFVFNGTESFLGDRSNSLPWHITYEGFGGTLPRITKVNLLLRGLRFGLVGFFCLATYGGPTANIRGEANLEAGGSGRVTNLTPEPEAFLRITEGGGTCPEPGRFEGAGVVTLLGNTTSIIIRLI